MPARRRRAGARTTLFSHSRQPCYESGANNHQPHPKMITERGGDSPNEEQQGASNAFELRPPICTETEFVDSPEVQQISEGNRCRRGSEARSRAGGQATLKRIRSCDSGAGSQNEASDDALLLRTHSREEGRKGGR